MSATTPEMPDRRLNIVTSKPKYPNSDHADDRDIRLAVIYRGVGTQAMANGVPELHMPWVVGTITTRSLQHGEWNWGHYFESRDEAIKFFDAQ